MTAPRRSRVGPALLVAAIVTTGVALRLWRLGDVPPGFHPDEAHNAIDAVEIARGWRPVFLPGNNGREPLFIYLMSAVLGVAGPSVWSARLTGVVAGTLVMPVLLVLGRALPVPRAKRVAVVATALAATTFWPVSQARFALRAGLLPLWVALTLWAWWRAIDVGVAPSTSQRGGARSLRWSILTGIFLAAGLYTHLTARLLPIVLAVSALAAVATTRRRAPLVALAAAVGTAVALSAPMLRYFARQPEMLSYRADQVSVLNPEVNQGDLAGTLVRNARALALAPLRAGDGSWYHNLDGLPVFEPLVGAAFVAGMLLLARDLAGRRGSRPRAFALLLLATLVATVTPSWLSVGAPNYVRLTGTWPPMFIAAGYGAVAIAAQLERRLGARAGTALIVLVLLVSGARHAAWYFRDYAGRPEVAVAFGADAVERGRLVADVVAAGPTYVSPELWQRSVIRYMSTTHPPRSYDLRSGLVLPPAGRPAYAFDASEHVAAKILADAVPRLFEREALLDRTGWPAIEVVRSVLSVDEALARLAPGGARIAAATFGDCVTLRDARIAASRVRPADAFTVTLLLHVAAPTAVDHNLFVHVVAADGRTIAQFDGPPLAGSYSTDRWAPGEWVVQPVTLHVDPTAPDGEAEVRVGLYDWRTAVRLSVPGDDDGAVAVGTVAVSPASAVPVEPGAAPPADG